MIVASGIAMQFGAKPLFENVNVKFGGGNRYGLIGANGCGKSTFMKILGGDLEPTAGSVAIDANEPRALWYLGVAAARAHEVSEAKAYWQKLLTVLPADSDEHKMVSDALGALPN